ncbi:SCO2102 family sporulation regulator [Streptomyces olivaceus]|uniref:SCO2102 family sporulation regulator n=1 Tax=Streptomyces olivaceus TaxID=47716 RepID=UPI00405758D3
MGWTVLYIAFGVVALWLLGEVLLQYKARLRWRLLAFGGFVGVVAGVLLSNVLVIGVGAAAFAVGQTYVTLSFRRGFEAGWAVNAPAGLKRGRGERKRREPTLEVSGLEAAEGGQDHRDGYGYEDAAQGYGTPAHGTPGLGGPAYGQDDPDRDDVFTPARTADPSAAETTAVYEPQPMPDDTGSYGVYADSGYAQAPQEQPAAAPGADQAYAYDYSGYGQQGYGYDTGTQQQYAAYSDPYIGTHTYGGGAYDTGGYDTTGGQGYGQQAYGQDQYAPGAQGGYGGETPAGGVWVPQQRSTDDPYGGELPPEQQPYPYQGNGQAQGQGQGQGQNQGYDEQYRF